MGRFVVIAVARDVISVRLVASACRHRGRGKVDEKLIQLDGKKTISSQEGKDEIRGT